MAEDFDPNAKSSGTAHNVLDYLARTLVDDADAVEISASQWRQRISLNLSVAPDDMGKVIGRRGRTAQAIRTIVRAAGARDGQDTFVEIVD
jgi:uncharacterized protein